MDQNSSLNIESQIFQSSEAYYIYKQKEIFSLLHPLLTQEQVEQNLKNQWKCLKQKTRAKYNNERIKYNTQLIQKPLNEEEEKNFQVEKLIEPRKIKPKKKYNQRRKKKRVRKIKKTVNNKKKNIQEKVEKKALGISNSLENNIYGQPPYQKKRQVKINILQKPKTQNFEQQIDSGSKPVPKIDFLNSANLIDHISVLSISNKRSNQGQIEFDQIKSVISHTYGVMNFTDIEDLKLQLFFEVEFHARQNGQIPDNTYCTSKQATLYCYDLTKNYIINNKEIFTKDVDYYLN